MASSSSEETRETVWVLGIPITTGTKPRGEFHKKKSTYYFLFFLYFYISTVLHFYISGKVVYFKATFRYVIQGHITQNLHNYTDVKI